MMLSLLTHKCVTRPQWVKVPWNKQKVPEYVHLWTASYYCASPISSQYLQSLMRCHSGWTAGQMDKQMAGHMTWGQYPSAWKAARGKVPSEIWPQLESRRISFAHSLLYGLSIWLWVPELKRFLLTTFSVKRVLLWSAPFVCPSDHLMLALSLATNSEFVQLGLILTLLFSVACPGK